MEGCIQIKQLPLAEFEYEVINGKYLNLYDRMSSEKGGNILRFLVQVPVDTDCITEGSIRQAVDKVYEEMEATTKLPVIKIQAEPLGGVNKTIAFL